VTARALGNERAEHADELLAAARALVGERRPELAAYAEQYPTGPADALIRLSEVADLIVVGRGRGTRADPLLGSVAQRVAAFARCPVVVLPTDPPTRAAAGPPVVAVGVTRAGGGAAALDAAFGHAQRVGGQVLAVRAWGELDWAGSVSMYTVDAAERWRLASQHLLDEAVTRAGRKYPAVPVETRLVRGLVTDALLEAAADADLLLLGGHDTGDWRISQLSSTSSHLLARASCPVEIVGWPQAESSDVDRPRALSPGSAQARTPSWAAQSVR
jgi:nucleotide-binding universal stress UspA family protein